MAIRRSNRSNKGRNRYLESILKEENGEDEFINVNSADDKAADRSDLLAKDGDYEYLNEDVLNNKDDDFIDDDEDERKDKRRHRTSQSHLNIRTTANKKRKVATGSAQEQSKLRQNARKLFEDLFAKFIIPDTLAANVYQITSGKSVDELSGELSKLLEEELYSSSTDKDHDQLKKYYPEKVRVLYSNLKDPKNLRLKDHIINGKLSFDKLVDMNASELANPDLQHFKEKIDSQSLNQLIIETPKEKPRWIKTHKGEELIEEQDEFKPENDVIFERDNITKMDATRQEEEVERVEDSKGNATIEPDQPTETYETLNRTAIDVEISYPEIQNEIACRLWYLGSSNKTENISYKTGLGDGKLLVEGRLSKGKVLNYLDEIKSTRNFLLYSVEPTEGDQRSMNNFTSLYQFLFKYQKILGIKIKQVYQKNIYLISAEDVEESLALRSIVRHSTKQERHGSFEETSKLYILIVIKPELLQRL